MIVVTGGAGFIGSAYIWRLNQRGEQNILVVDDLGKGEKWKNLAKRQIYDSISIKAFRDLIKGPGSTEIKAVVHMGACSSTTETDADFLVCNNTHYSAEVFEFCVRQRIPFIYASSAATYGLGEGGYKDDEASLDRLVPINKYAYSKQLFDTWLLKQKKKPPLWAGFKFFNVYGPNEYHKGSQASVVFHAFPQIKEGGKLKLFKSYLEAVEHGQQKRDFVYIKDVVEMMDHLLLRANQGDSGIYNIGTGTARSFADLGKAVFAALESSPARFEWIEMPDSLKSQYQYFTQAEMNKFRQRTNYDKPLTDLESGIDDYVRNYLLGSDPYL